MILPPDPANPAQVTKIPIAGPAPFNTLVMVAGNLMGSGPGVFATHEVQTSATFVTNYTLPHYDSRVASATAAHSTAAWLARIGPASRPAPVDPMRTNRFIYSIDDLATVGFTDAGQFAVQVDFSILAPEPPDPQTDPDCYIVGETIFCTNVYRVWISSYLLVYEPPLSRDQQRHLAQAASYRRAVPWAGRLKPISARIPCDCSGARSA